MNLSLRPLDSKAVLDDFLARPELRRYNKFYQSWEWGDVEASHGSRTHRLGFWEGDQLRGVALAVDRRDRLGRYLYCPRGPVTDYGDPETARAVLRQLIAFGRLHAAPAVFLRVDPPILHDSAAGQILPSLGFRPAGTFTQVERAWMVDLEGRSDQDLLDWMKQHGMRSNIPRYLRRGKKLGIAVRSSTDQRDLDIFLEMTRDLNQRKGGIGMLPADYYRRQFAVMSQAGYERLFIAERDGEPVCAAMIAIYGDEGSYLHGASLEQYRELHAPHVMHWEVMRFLRDRGCDRYNFWGVVKKENHRPGRRGYGFSEFKRSFGGYVERYMRTADYPYRRLRYPLVWMNDYRRLKQFQLE